MTKLTLTERVHNLAPELFEKVYEAFIAVNEDDPVSIDADYEFPVQLHVDRSTRRRYAERYYRRPFKASIPSLSTSLQDTEQYEDPRLREWLNSVPAEHRSLIRNIEIEQATYGSCFSHALAHQRVGRIMRFIRGQSYHMPDLVVFAIWGTVCNSGAGTVLVRSEGFRISS